MQDARRAEWDVFHQSGPDHLPESGLDCLACALTVLYVEGGV